MYKPMTKRQLDALLFGLRHRRALALDYAGMSDVFIKAWCPSELTLAQILTLLKKHGQTN